MYIFLFFLSCFYSLSVIHYLSHRLVLLFPSHSYFCIDLFIYFLFGITVSKLCIFLSLSQSHAPFLSLVIIVFSVSLSYMCTCNMHIYLYLLLSLALFHTYLCNHCSGSLNPFHTVSHCIKWVRTPWTYSIAFILWFECENKLYLQ